MKKITVFRAFIMCETLNTVHSRRCIGVHNGKRCDNFFEWKDCPECNLPNDTTSRLCRGCGHELIDPNAKLSLKPAKLPRETFDVVSGKLVLDSSRATSDKCHVPTNEWP